MWASNWVSLYVNSRTDAAENKTMCGENINVNLKLEQMVFQMEGRKIINEHTILFYTLYANQPHALEASREQTVAVPRETLYFFQALWAQSAMLAEANLNCFSITQTNSIWLNKPEIHHLLSDNFTWSWGM